MNLKTLKIKQAQKNPQTGIKSTFLMLIFSVIFTLMTPVSYAGTLGARLDRSKISAGETVSLSIALPQTGSPSGQTQPDLSPLTKNFQILGSGTSSQVQIINGKRSENHELSITLMPKQQGTLEIPAIKVGQDSTEPLTLTVSAAPAIDTAKAGNPVWLELETSEDSHNVMVNQEIPLTVRLYTALPLRDISLSKPEPANAVVEKLGDAKQYQVERDGNNYQVIEQRYAIFPEKAGDLTIPPVILRATVPQQQAGNARNGPFNDPLMNDSFGANYGFGSSFSSLLNDSFFSNAFNRGKPLRLASDGMKFYVEHIPEVAKGQNWLPASMVSLEDSWKDNPPVFKSGEPVTLTVTVKAEGLSGSQIPALTFPATKNLRVYNEPAQNESFSDGEHVTGISTQTFTLIPEFTGEIKIPEIKIPWWDINQKSMQTARLPARSVNVVQGNGGAYAAKPLDPAATKALMNDTGSHANASSQSSAASPPATTEINQSMMPRDTWLGLELNIILLILAALIVIVLFYLGKKRRSGTPSTLAKTTLTKTAVTKTGASAPPVLTNEASVSRTEQQRLLQSHKQDFMQACEQNDSSQAAKNLLLWAQQSWPENPPTSLKIIADQLAEGDRPVLELHRYLYKSKPDAQPWNGKQLASALAKGLIRKAPDKNRQDHHTLQPLYPI